MWRCPHCCCTTVKASCTSGIANAVDVVANIELAAVISQLRDELGEAMSEGEGDRLRFGLGPIELSLTLTVSRETTPGAKVRFWVVEAGGEARFSRESLQELKLVLTPRDMTVAVSADGSHPPPLISGAELSGERGN
jgi:hypothetical protein